MAGAGAADAEIAGAEVADTGAESGRLAAEALTLALAAEGGSEGLADGTSGGAVCACSASGELGAPVVEKIFDALSSVARVDAAAAVGSR